MDKSNFSSKGDNLLSQAEKKLKGKILTSIVKFIKLYNILYSQYSFIWFLICFIGGFWKNLTTSKEDRMDEAKDLY